MKKSEIKYRNQVIFFDMLEKAAQPEIDFIHEVSSLLKLESDAIYRRKNGLTALKFEEALILCKHFNISIDSLVDITADSKYILCSFAPYELKDLKTNLSFAQNMSVDMENIKMLPKKEIMFSAADIPVFNFLAYNELAFFNIFTWNKNMCGFSENYDDFIKTINAYEYLEYFEKIVKNYQLIPSTEIWSGNTIESTLSLLNYHYEMKHFSNKKIPLLICEQLLDLMDTLQNWTKKGIKGVNDTPFKFYISEIDIGNTFILFKKLEKKHCLIRLFTINGLSILDEQFCKETETWLQNLIKRSTLISGTAEKEGFNFFENQKEKIKNLIEKI